MSPVRIVCLWTLLVFLLVEAETRHNKTHSGAHHKNSPGQIESYRNSPAQTERHKNSPAQTERHKKSPSQTERHKKSPAQTERHKKSPAQTGRHKKSSAQTERHKNPEVQIERHKKSPAQTGRDKKSRGQTKRQRKAPGHAKRQRDSHSADSLSETDLKEHRTALTGDQINLHGWDTPYSEDQTETNDIEQKNTDNVSYENKDVKHDKNRPQAGRGRSGNPGKNGDPSQDENYLAAIQLIKGPASMQRTNLINDLFPDGLNGVIDPKYLQGSGGVKNPKSAKKDAHPGDSK